MKLKAFSSYKTAIDFLMYGLSKSGGKVFRGEAGLAKSKRFFAVAGNPHSNLRAIHIAGTSGKGTVAYMIEAILRAHGFSTGLSLSPHVYDIRERAQINGRLVSKSAFLTGINRILPAIIDRFIAGEGPTYFQVTTLLSFEIMKKQKVDYAIIETGLGGLYDSSNVIERADKLCVITRIGKDHTQILGRSYKAIAGQKAGIIQPNNQVVALHQRADVNRVFRQQAKIKHASLNWVFNDETMQLSNPRLQAPFQTENIALAMKTVRLLSERDNWQLSIKKSLKALNELNIPGRFGIVQQNRRTVVFDGAHNAQKVTALVSQFKQLYPNEKATIILALKKDKNVTDILVAIKPIAREIVATRFLSAQDMSSLSHDPKQIANKSESLGIKSKHFYSAQDAVDYASTIEGIVLVTGSNYLLGEVHQLLGL